ncbi:molecular chaperone [Cronobacter turicensis]|uniref:fimbrial biogenesis chaperone n=1 Tax=Cronobacter turicensis TaxID=413502 RepID=UPI001D85FEB4|nr:molecular chaperone [Cronobacter turicensis]EGT5682895.1 molecular chaperone [Cronobacter turicensis]EGT5739268.1 molecular chaperone [Cronobacter turicensis]ELY6321122.1 molecular chaperone [Cronobacter turicensis]MDI6431005.1 molecular chaperone [Cronobacter turicensis]
MRKLIAISVLLMSATAAQAGVIVGGTRVVYQSDKKEASVPVTNNDDINYLIQSWVDTDATGAAKAPFMVTPPLFRLDAHQDNTLRVVRTGGNLPEDRESLYWLNIKSIPSAAKKEGVNRLQIAIKTRIKLMYRPASINGKPDDVANMLKWHTEGNTLVVENPTSFYMNFNNISINGNNLNDINFAVPKGESRFQLAKGMKHGTLSWTIINDFGAISKTWSQNI